jgi:hypothetical protein
MAIPEAQLDTWSAQGSVNQSAATYETIRKVLNDPAAPYHSRDYSVFLQGSYGNDTNIWKDSDVDIVMCLDETYYSDTNSLTDAAKANYKSTFSPAAYTYVQFKAEVIAWLTKNFGSDVKPGKKAAFIKGNGNRRDADVIVCAEHKRWRQTSSGVDGQYETGIVFWLPDGTDIVNFPKQHSANCTTKHQDTNGWFKPLVRVYKNMRNRMIDDGYLEEGIAPSYFVEGMLWNVPNEKFGKSYTSSWVGAFNWLIEADETNLACANDLHWLVRENTHVCWSSANFHTFLNAASKYWDDWT